MPFRKGTELFYTLYLLTLIKPCEVDTILTVCKKKCFRFTKEFLKVNQLECGTSRTLTQNFLMSKSWLVPVGLNKSLSHQGSPWRREWLLTPYYCLEISMDSGA